MKFEATETDQCGGRAFTQNGHAMQRGGTTQRKHVLLVTRRDVLTQGIHRHIDTDDPATAGQMLVQVEAMRPGRL